MKTGKLFLISVIFVFLAAPVHAQTSYHGHLTDSDIERVKAVKALLDGVDTKPLRDTINELERSRHPRINLEMQEAMARAYTDIAKEFGVAGQKKKEWLYSMVCLNMAYLQFGGGSGTSRDTSDLNRLIRQKLKEYLPADVVNQAGFLYSLE